MDKEKGVLTLTTDELTELVAKVAMNMVKGDLRDMVARVVEDKVCEIMEKAVGQMREEIAAQERKEWLEAGTIADEIWEARKRGECQPTLRERLLEWESNHRMEHW